MLILAARPSEAMPESRAMHAMSAKKSHAAPDCAAGTPSATALVGSPEQRAAVDPAKPGVCDDLQVPALVAAGMLGIKRQTLALWRCTRSQPLRYVKVGRRVSYRLGDLRRFIESRTELPVQAA